MTNKTIMLAGKPISVPQLPLRLTMKAYNPCRRLANNGYAERYIKAAMEMAKSRGRKGSMEVTDEELADLAEIAFCGAAAADPGLTREAFDEWTVTPGELIDAYFQVRIQTGGWVVAESTDAGREEGQEEPGEVEGAI